MARREDPTGCPAPAAPRGWEAQWATVPKEWRRPVYRIDSAPAATVFLQNRYYLREHRRSSEHDFSPAGTPRRFAHEVAWWVWLCHHEGLRRIEPSVLKCQGRTGDR